MTQIEISNQLSDGKIERPLAVTIICILGFLGTALSIPMVFSDIAKQIGDWFPPYSGAIAAISFFCMIGLWLTKKWAMYAYTSLVVVNHIVLIVMDRWSVLPLIVHVTIVAVILISLEDYAKSLTHQLLIYIKRQIWALIVAYMVGIHNFYKGEQKTPEDIVITIENIEEQEDDAPKD